MVEKRTPRRLAAILAADVVGYSRLMEQDEAGTLALLESRLKDVIEPLVAQHEGRVFKSTGDGALVEFRSAVNAVQSPSISSKRWPPPTKGSPTKSAIVLRIGINLGDVMVDGSDLYGDGVNLAARLEAMAEPGGICISGSSHDQVKRKLSMAFEDTGRQPVKNIAEPVQVYRLALACPAGPNAFPRRTKRCHFRRSRRSPCCPSRT